MRSRLCAFETHRLKVEGWHAIEGPDLARVVASLLTEPVTRSLPPPWQGAYTVARARHWIAERDAEGATLIIVDRTSQQPVGLLILFEEAAADGAGIDVRLGYLLAESAWGRGLASELVAGLVGWCRGQDTIASLSGGVALDNPASRRVLQKSGFRPSERETARSEGEEILTLRLGDDLGAARF